MFYVEEGSVFLVDKPIDWTSFDTVNFVRALFKRFYGIRKLKVGHAGTLDPLATGLLILCTGPMTKKIEDFQAQVKTYTGTLLLGQSTPTYDLESEPDAFFPTDHITPEEIVETVIETEAKAVAMTTYNGIALSFAKELKEKMEKAGVSVLIILGGLLNENIDGESLATDVSDKLRELGVNADNDMAKIIPAVKEACDAEE